MANTNNNSSCLVIGNVDVSTGCETWTIQEGFACLGGSITQFTTLEDCKQMCSLCIAIDVSAIVCVVHTNTAHLAVTYNVTSYTRYTLHATGRTTDAPTTTTLYSTTTSTFWPPPADNASTSTPSLISTAIMPTNTTRNNNN